MVFILRNHKHMNLNVDCLLQGHTADLNILNHVCVCSTEVGEWTYCKATSLAHSDSTRCGVWQIRRVVGGSCCRAGVTGTSGSDIKAIERL